MRRYQVSINVEDLSQLPHDTHNYHVYADANNFYEALGEATKSITDLYQLENDKPFGRTTVSIDKKVVLDI